jgi:ribosome-associated toxin RatA of RatAB toxin-antitoxin module
MQTVDLLETTASPARMFAVARDVERWPELLPHYRYVRILVGSTARGIVAMSANRPFGSTRCAGPCTTATSRASPAG